MKIEAITIATMFKNINTEPHANPCEHKTVAFQLFETFFPFTLS